MSKKTMNRLFLPLALSLAMISSASAIEMRGQISYSYQGGMFSSSPSDEDKAAAVKAAKTMALKQYFSTLGPAQQRLLRDLQPRIEANPDDFLTGYTIVAEDVNKDNKVYNLVIRAGIKEQLISSELKANTTSNMAVSGSGSAFTALFVARRIIESKQFKERETTVSKVDVEQSGSYSQGTETMSKTEMKSSGGNVVRKATQNSYGKLSSTDFDASFNEVMTSNGFETIDYSDVASECGGPEYSAIQDAFMKGDDLPQALRSKAIKASKKCDVQYFATGYMNVGAPETDTVSGNRKVVVSVNGMVWNIEKRLPRKVGSVGPVQAFGMGPDDDTARRVALEIAAKQAADSIASQLGAKNIK